MPTFLVASSLRAWATLLFLSLAIAWLFAALHLPAALFLGAMVGGVLLAVRGLQLKAHPWPQELAQAAIGCLIAQSFTPQVLAEMAHEGWLLMTVVMAVLGSSAALAWAVGRGGRIPGSTAIWGLLPGGSITMMLMADAFGADARMVALMQNMRLVVVASSASLVAAWAAPTSAAELNPAWGGLFLPVAPAALATTLALMLGSVLVAKVWKGLAAGSLLYAMLMGGVLHGLGLIQLALPVWLLGPSFLLLGWSVGLRFTLDALKQAAHALPHMAGAIALLVAFCAALAGALVHLAAVDPLTAYLATSPGGADSIAIIAASSPVDLPFVMTLQSLRVLVILIAGPFFARYLAEKMRQSETRTAPPDPK